MSYFYSATTNSFYPVEMREDYEKAGTWPHDVLAVDDLVYEEFVLDAPPEGKVRIPNNDGYPSWEDISAPTKDQIILKNTRIRAKLAQDATVAITTLQAGIETSRSVVGDNDALTAWLEYLCDLRSMTSEELQQTSAPFPAQPTAII